MTSDSFLKKWKLPESFHAWMYMINIKISISIVLGSAIVEPIPTDLNRLYQPKKLRWRYQQPGCSPIWSFLSHVNVQILLLEGRRIAGVRQVYDRTDRRRVYWVKQNLLGCLELLTSGLRISKAWANTWQQFLPKEWHIPSISLSPFDIRKRKIIRNSDHCNRSHCFWWNIQLPAD